jgi:hypothetical protein
MTFYEHVRREISEGTTRPMEQGFAERRTRQSTDWTVGSGFLRAQRISSGDLERV